MRNSLQDQLLKSGLASEKQAKKPKKARKQPKKKKSERGQELSESAKAAQKAREEKAARDRELNEKRKAEQERKALEAQVRQLIKQNRVKTDKADQDYHFVDGVKVRTLGVTADLRRQLASGALRIVRFGKRYDLVPLETAERIAERDEEYLIPRPVVTSDPDPEGPYAEYVIPDDMIW